MHVVSLDKYKNRELIGALKDLLELAEKGRAHGLAFVVKLGHRDHRAGVAGDYKRFPEQALSATFQMERHLRESPDDFEESAM